MPSAKRKAGVSYQRLLHEVTVHNSSLPPEKQLSLKERYEFISQKIYPRFKDIPAYKFRITEARKAIANGIRRRPPKETCDVNTIPERLYTGVDYYDIEYFFKNKLPGCIWVQVSAGNFGNTQIFNTRDFDYYESGVNKITNAINDYVRDLPKPKVSGEVFYDGYPQLRPGKKNDGDPENYYLDMVLNEGRVKYKKVEIIQLPETVKKKAKVKKKKVAKIIDEKIKKIKFKESKTKKINRAIITGINSIKEIRKARYIPTKQKESIAKAGFDYAKKILDKHLKAKEITKKKYDELISKIKRGYGQKKDNRKKG
jgi:hypothetical protein